MDNFTFNGRDIAELGAQAAFGAAMKTGARISRSEYALPGGGSVVIGEDTYEATQRAVTIIPAPGVTPTPQWRREILTWLHGGRGELALHSDPGVVRVAQFDLEGTWGTQQWPDGAIQMTMTLQPLCYAAQAHVQTAQTSGGSAQITLTMDTALPSALEIRCEVTSGALTDLTLAVGGKTLALTGMGLTAGQAILYDAGDMLGDVMRLQAAGAAGFGYVTRWAKLMAMPGQALSVTAAGAEVSVTVRARGRWIA